MSKNETFSSTYKDDTLSNLSNLLICISNYDEISTAAEEEWKNNSIEVVNNLKLWRRLYKQLDNKKRMLKRVGGSSGGASAGGSAGLPDSESVNNTE